MTLLIVITIVIVAYWAATGGLDEIQAGNTGAASAASTQTE